jgi:hypothetical protein
MWPIPESIEKPAVMIFLFQTEDDLNWCDSFIGSFDFERRSDGDLGGVLVDVVGHVSVADLGLCDTILVAPHGSEDGEGPGVDLGATVANDADNDLFPALLTPRFTPVSLAQVHNVFDDTVHRARE